MFSGAGGPADTGALRLQALEAAAEVLGSKEALESVVPRVLEAVSKELGWATSAAWLVDRAAGQLQTIAFWSSDHSAFREFERVTRSARLPLDAGVPGRVLTSGAPVWIEDVTFERAFLRAPTAGREGLRTAIAVPIALEGEMLGVMEFFHTAIVPRDDGMLGMLGILGAEVGLLIERVRAEERSRRSEERLRRTVQLLAAERRVLEMVARGQPLEAALSELTRTIEELCPGILASVLLLDPDGKHLRHGAAPSVPAAWSRRIDGIEIGPNVGSCGTAAYEKQTVIAADITTDPRWTAYQAEAIAHGLRACWSAPILTGDATVLGTFAMYYRQAREPDAEHLLLIEAAAHVARIAIERHRRDVERARLVEDLQRAVRFTEMFVGVLSHDLRNPLNAVINGAHVLELSKDPALAPKIGEKILASGQRMARMIDHLLDFSRIRLGQGVPLDPRPADLADLCRLAIEELRARRDEREVIVEQLGDTTGAWDRDRLLQLVSNLIGNALQHGARPAAVRVRVDGREPGVLTLAVTNAGSIPEALIPGLFDPFKRAADADVRPGGLGLGLFISREVARAHGGTIELVTTADSTCFEVKLPRKPRHASFLPSRST